MRERDREREKERKRFKQATVFEKRRPLDETKKYAQENPKQLEKPFSLQLKNLTSKDTHNVTQMNISNGFIDKNYEFQVGLDSATIL